MEKMSFLSEADQQLIRFDSKCLSDLGLKMPRITKKYWLGVLAVSKIQFVSPYFMHIAEAKRKGTIYKWLKEYGYTWNCQAWGKRPPPA